MAASQSIGIIAQAIEQERQLAEGDPVLRFVADFRRFQLSEPNDSLDYELVILSRLEKLWKTRPHLQNRIDLLQEIDFTIQNEVNSLYNFPEIPVTTVEEAKIVLVFTHRPLLLAASLESDIIDDIRRFCLICRRRCIQDDGVVLNDPDVEDDVDGDEV